METPTAIKKALNHVRTIFPDVTMVVFNTEGRWQYMDDDFISPVFGGLTNQQILEEAADAITELPAVFHINNI